jgi:hypothetical protein
MVKFSVSLFVAALIAAPAFASITGDELDIRELSDYELFGRDLTEAEATLFARDYDELFTRHPDELDAREYEDISRRTSIAKKIRNGFKKAFGFVKSLIFRREGGQEELFAREYDELDARDLDAIYQRYIEELVARAPEFFQHILQDGMNHVKAIAHHGEEKKETPVAPVAPEPEVRDLDELSERDFSDDDLVERDLDLDLDLVERDFDEDLYEREVDDLVERDLDLDLDLVERDFDEDLYEREYFGDLFDLVEREVDDLVERDLDLDLDLVERDFDEGLYEREYVSDLLALVEREIDDLEERSFDDLD